MRTEQGGENIPYKQLPSHQNKDIYTLVKKDVNNSETYINELLNHKTECHRHWDTSFHRLFEMRFLHIQDAESFLWKDKSYFLGEREHLYTWASQRVPHLWIWEKLRSVSCYWPSARCWVKFNEFKNNQLNRSSLNTHQHHSIG